MIFSIRSTWMGHIGGLTLHSAERLMDHDLGVRKRQTLALCAGGQEKRAHRRGHTDADRLDVHLDILHRIVDGHPLSRSRRGLI